MAVIENDSVEFLHPDTGARVRIPVVLEYEPGVNISRVGSFPARSVIGDDKRFYHEWLSGLVQSNWAGGGQITKSQESTDITRYADIATLDTRWPHQLTLLPRTYEIEGPNTDGAWPLGELRMGIGDVRFYAAFGEELCRIELAVDETGGTPTVTAIDTLAEEPHGLGVRFRGSLAAPVLWIPQPSGYQTWDGSGTADAQVTTFAPISFCVLNGVLYALDGDGGIWQNVDGMTASWTLLLAIGDGSLPRSLVRFRDSANQPSLWAVTDAGAYSIDTGSRIAYSTDFNFPPHLHAARGAATWRQDLFITYVLDTGKSSGGTITYVGLMRGDGPGEDWQNGVAVSLADAWNELLQLMEGATTATEETDLEFTTEGQLTVPSNASPASLMRHDGFGGWHTAWSSGIAGGAATHIMVTSADAEWRALWGWDGKLYAQDLKHLFQNPRLNPTEHFEQTGKLTSSIFTLGNQNLRYILAAVQVQAYDLSETETVSVRYQLDPPSGLWYTLDLLNGDSVVDPNKENIYTFYAGRDGNLPNGSPRYTGQEFGSIRYEVTLNRDPDDDTKKPIVEAITFVFMPTMGELKSFTFRADCSNDMSDGLYGMSNRERREFLQNLQTEAFVGFSSGGDDWFNVKVTGVNGFFALGQDDKGDVSVTLVETFDL